MKRRYVGVIAGIGLLSGVVALGYGLTHPKITITNVHIKTHPVALQADSPSAPAVAPALVGAAARPGDAPRPTPVAQAPAAPVPDLDGHAWIGRLDGPLTDQQRAQLDHVFKMISTMQTHIDQNDDAAQRADMQDKLIHQLVVRLRIVLGDERVHDEALALSQTKPRIRYE